MVQEFPTVFLDFTTMSSNHHIWYFGRQFEFTQVKVVKLGVGHYDYNTRWGNNNVRHNYSDHAHLPSRVLKM